MVANKLKINIPCNSKFSKERIAKELEKQGFKRYKADELYFMCLYVKDNIIINLELINDA